MELRPGESYDKYNVRPYARSGSAFDVFETNYLKFGFNTFEININGIYGTINGDLENSVLTRKRNFLARLCKWVYT